MVGVAMVIRGDARALPLPDASVDLVVTSPPYFALRSYTDGGEHFPGQIGSEATPADYIAALLDCTREMVRVLKPGGSIWVDLGDKYAGGGGFWPTAPSNADGRRRNNSPANVRTEGIPSKSLMLLPERYRIAAVDQLGLIARAVVIWSKCLSGGTEVYARVNGREKVVMIKDLARCVAGSVELWTGETWSAMVRCEPTPPTAGRSASSTAARMARYRGKPVPPLTADLEIEFRNGVRVGCTPNHKWPTAGGILRADELTVGAVVPTVQLPAGHAAPAGLDDEMTGWLVGLYIAEGSRSEDIVQIASHVQETARFNRLRQVAEAFDGRFALHSTKGNACTANLSGKVIRAILDSYVGGRIATDKRLAPACWRRSNTFLRALLDGYLSGDGHYESKTDRWVLGFTSNDGLATDLRAVAARLGYSMRLRRTVHRFDGRDFPGWSGTLYTDPARRKRPDGEVVAIRQSRARQFWNIEIADEPHQFALAAGLLTENSNGLPESVTDRVRRSHEDWVHLTKAPRYFSAVDAIREGYAPGTAERYRTGYRVTGRLAAGAFNSGTLRQTAAGDGGPSDTNPLGKLPGSVWAIPTEPLTVPDHLGIDHFAAFPTEWPRRIILGWSPEGVCADCGFLLGSTYDNGLLGVRRSDQRRPHQASLRPEARITHQAVLQQDMCEPLDREESRDDDVPPADDTRVRRGLAPGASDVAEERLPHGAPSGHGGASGSRVATARGRAPQERDQDGQSDRESGAAGQGRARPTAEARPEAVPVPALRRPDPDVRNSLACPNCGRDSLRPSVIVDPFGGTGTTALVASVLDRHGIAVDLSADYCRLARWRTNDPAQLAKAMRVDKPPVIAEAQLSLEWEVA